MKFIGQFIQNLIARFRNDVYLEDIDTGTIVSGGNLGLDSNNKIVKNTVGGGGTTDLTSDVTGILPVANGGTGQNSLGSVNISDLNNDSGFTTNTGDINRVTINTSSGSAQVTSGNADFTLSGTTPIGVTNSGTTITIAANDATTSNKGVAKFNASYFSVSSGNVSLADGAVDFSEDIITGTLPVGKGGTGVTSLGSINISSFNNDSGFTANTGDITGVTAGTNLSGGGSSGAVTINLADASESAKGAVELATTAEADTGTDTSRAVTPAGLKSHIDARFSYQYISFTGNATVPADGDWITVSANGISNHTWNTDLGSGGTTVDTSTVTIPTGAICQGIIVPYDCTLVGYASLIRSIGNHQSKVGLAVGVPTYNDFATFNCTLRAYNAADISAGPDTNYSQRPVRADSLSVNHSMSAGHVIFPLIGSVASNSRTVQWNCTLVLKTLLP
jgi:hypothetical protein